MPLGLLKRSLWRHIERMQVLLEHRPTQTHDNGSFAPIMTHSSFGLVTDDLQRWPFGRVQGNEFFPARACLYSVLDRPHSDAPSRSVTWIEPNPRACARPWF